MPSTFQGTMTSNLNSKTRKLAIKFKGTIKIFSDMKGRTLNISVKRQISSGRCIPNTIY
jgi:hypothetical protein